MYQFILFLRDCEYEFLIELMNKIEWDTDRQMMIGKHFILT